MLLFIAGIIPGILVGLGMMLVIYFLAFKKDFPKYDRKNISEFLPLFKESFPALLTPIIIIGGVITGWYTATEAAAFASLYTLIIGMFFYKTLKLSDLPKSWLRP